MKAKNLNAGFFKRPYCFIDVSGRNEAMIGDEQGALELKFARQLAETVDDSGAKDHASTGLKVKLSQIVDPSLARKKHKKRK
jgi:hypothetical protein